MVIMLRLVAFKHSSSHDSQDGRLRSGEFGSHLFLAEFTQFLRKFCCVSKPLRPAEI